MSSRNLHNDPPNIPSSYTYTSCYCEENIYLLCQTFLANELVASVWDPYVIFISNESRTVSLQRFLFFLSKKRSNWRTVNLAPGCIMEPEKCERRGWSRRLGLSCYSCPAPKSFVHPLGPPSRWETTRTSWFVGLWLWLRVADATATWPWVPNLCQ